MFLLLGESIGSDDTGCLDIRFEGMGISFHNWIESRITACRVQLLTRLHTEIGFPQCLRSSRIRKRRQFLPKSSNLAGTFHHIY